MTTDKKSQDKYRETEFARAQRLWMENCALQKELEAARAEIENLKYCHKDACADVSRLLKQLAYAKKQIEALKGTGETD